MNRVPEPISGATWRYVAIYVLSLVFGVIACLWGTWLAMPFVTASVTTLPALVHDSKTTFGVIIAVAGGAQAGLRGPIARGFTLMPFAVGLCWAVWCVALASGTWHTPGPLIYGVLALVQFGMVALINYELLEEAAAVIRQTVTELRRG